MKCNSTNKNRGRQIVTVIMKRITTTTLIGLRKLIRTVMLILRPIPALNLIPIPVPLRIQTIIL